MNNTLTIIVFGILYVFVIFTIGSIVEVGKYKEKLCKYEVEYCDKDQLINKLKND
jgi:hypothetical protein